MCFMFMKEDKARKGALDRRELQPRIYIEKPLSFIIQGVFSLLLLNIVT